MEQENRLADASAGEQNTTDVASAAQVRVLVVDDHELFRLGLCQLLADAGFDVVGSAPGGELGIELTLRARPDVVLMDLDMPGMGGLEATRRLAEQAPDVRVLVFTISAEPSDALDAVVAGAAGYVLKTAPMDELVAGIRAVAGGEALVSPGIASLLLRRIRGIEGEPVQEPPAGLSERDVVILRLLADGKDNAEIARLLCLSPKTVKNNLTEILRALRLANRTQAAVYAVRSGLA